jgi:hypothetical protein
MFARLPALHSFSNSAQQIHLKAVSEVRLWDPQTLSIRHLFLRRGESTIVVFFRAVILNCIVVGVPAFAIYSIFKVPVRSERYIRTLVTGLTRLDLPGNVTFYVVRHTRSRSARVR